MQPQIKGLGDRVAFLEQRQNRLLRICEIQSRIVRADFNLDDFMQTAVDLLKDFTGAAGVVVELIEGDELVYRAIDAEHGPHLGLRLSRSASLSGLCVEQHDILHCVDAELDPRVDRDACRAVGVRSMICAPLLEEGVAVGALKAFDPRPDAFDDGDIESLSLMADTLGAALGKQLEAHQRRSLLEERSRTMTMLFDAVVEARETARRAEMAEAIAGLGHWRFDLETRESIWSAQMCDIHGVPRGQAPSAESVVAMIHPDDRTMVGRHMRESAERGLGVERIVFKLYRADGVLRCLEASTGVEKDAAGRPIAIVGVVRDVTEQHEQQEALRQAQAEAESAARVKAEFLANMTHELRTPLTAVIGFSRLIEKQPELTDETRLHVDRVLNAGQALLSTINDLLDFSKLEAGQVEIAPRPMVVADVARRALDLFSHQAAEKRIALVVETADDLPVSILADPDRLRQVLLNLVSNAVKFTDHGEVRLRATRAAQDEILFEVLDTGAGVPDDKIGDLFQRFSQVDGQSRGRIGTGLGLSICRGLAEAMGGRVGVESRLGKGSRFWLALPLLAVDPLEGDEDDLGDLVGRRVLVVDDNPANRILVRSILSTVGAQVTEAVDGFQAVALADAQDFDLVLMDLRMPGLDGAAAAQKIRDGQGRGRATPILAFSADRDVDLCGGLFAGLVTKPVDPESLLLAVARTR